MLLYRLANPSFCRDPNEWAAGTGGLFGAARWHPKGHRIVYLAPSKANGLLEMAVQDSQLASYYVLEFDIPDSVSRRDLDESRLPKDWRLRSQYPICQRLGHEWLTSSKKTALLRVPSAPLPGDYNYLLNPLVDDARDVKVRFLEILPVDVRLIRHPV